MKRLKNMTDAALTALEARGIEPELAAKLGVVSASPAPGDNREWLAFPHRTAPDAPTHWQFRTITGDKQFLSSSGTSDHRTFFNAQILFDRSLAEQRLIITEGQLDALALMSAGYVRVVSVPDGAPAANGQGSKRKYAYLEPFEKIFQDCQEVIIAADDDEPGHALQRDLIARLGPERCKWTTYDGCKDANELLVASGPSALVNAIEAARWAQLDGFYQDILDVPPLPESEILRFSDGAEGLDEIWRIQRGRLTVLVGIPSHGKTALLNDATTELVKRYPDLVVTFASFEQYPRPDHQRNLRRSFLRKDPNHATAAEIAEADRWISNHFAFIVPCRDEPPTFDWLIERARFAVLRANAGIIVIDPWNELSHENRPADITMTEYIGVMLRKLRRFAQEYHVHVIVAVHPAKMPRDGNGRVSTMPTGYDCADSAHWVNKTDTGLSIHRKDATRTIIRNWKSRVQPDLGRPGSIAVAYQAGANRFVYVGESDD